MDSNAAIEAAAEVLAIARTAMAFIDQVSKLVDKLKQHPDASVTALAVSAEKVLNGSKTTAG